MTVYELIQELAMCPGDAELVFDIYGEEEYCCSVKRDWGCANEVKIKIE